MLIPICLYLVAIVFLNNSLTANNNQFYFDYQDGKYGFNTNPNRGADTFIPFNGSSMELVWENQDSFQQIQGNIVLNFDFSKYNCIIIVAKRYYDSAETIIQ